MATAFVPGLQVKEMAVVRRTRELPVAGETLKEPTEAVRANEIVARAFLAGELHILRIPETLGIEAHEAIAALLVNEGEKIEIGQVICEHHGLFGLFKSRFKSPVSGTVELITKRTGHLAVRSESIPLSLNAYISGQVVSVKKERAVSIESSAAFVQGIFGVGGERIGILQGINVSCDKSLEVSDLPVELSDKIIFGGTRPSLEVLLHASRHGAKGLIVGSIDDRALAGYLGKDLGIALTGDEDISMTVIVTEGFGEIPISKKIYDLLLKFDGKEASINGATQVRAGALRPEIIVPHERSDLGRVETGAESVGLEVGSKVRIIRVPLFGERGEVMELPHKAQQIETGAHARVLVAKLEDGRVVTVPRANVELV